MNAIITDQEAATRRRDHLLRDTIRRVVGDEARDVHVYIDASGSMAVDRAMLREIAVAIRPLRDLARRQGTRVLVDAFVHMFAASGPDGEGVALDERLSDEEVVDKIHDVASSFGGGTDLRPVWEHVSTSEERSLQLSVVVSDLQIYATNDDRKASEPEKLIYLPVGQARYIHEDAWRFAALFKEDAAEVGTRVVGLQNTEPQAVPAPIEPTPGATADCDNCGKRIIANDDWWVHLGTGTFACDGDAWGE